MYPVALRFDEFFHGTFKTPQITNVNLIVAVLLVESNTMVVVRKLLILINFQFTSRQIGFESSCDFRRRIDISDQITYDEYEVSDRRVEE